MLLPREPTSGEAILPIKFWHLGDGGPQKTVRQIELVRWADLESNYSKDTKARLAGLMDGFKPAKYNGRLLLWHGEPGTGETFAIRALAWAWRTWCKFEYVIDPERLFDSGGYLTEVVLNRRSDPTCEQNEEHDKWRLLIVEDSGEMLAMDAKSQIGQGLSRLLNLSDGNSGPRYKDYDSGHDERGFGQIESRNHAARSMFIGNRLPPVRQRRGESLAAQHRMPR